MSSKNYWREREERQRKQNIKNEAEYQKKLDDIYANMLDNIEKEINGFYVKYAKAEGITMAEAKKRIAKIDIEAYAKKAKRYVKDKDLSKKANDEMRYYNAAMKINRLELLKANIGMHLVGGYDEIEKMFGDVFTQRTEEEMRKQAGILGKTINDNAKKANVIVNASYKKATWSERIWAHQSMLKSEIDKLLQEGLIQGKHPSVLARHLEKRFGVSESNAMRLMVTELARVQTEAQKQSFIQNSFEEYEYIACEKTDACGQCRALDGKVFKVKDMMPGENAPPMHPYCHCSTAAHMDDNDYEKWLDTYSEHGLDFEEWSKRNSVEKDGEHVIINSGAIKGALTDKNDPLHIKRDSHADKYYEAVRNSKKSFIVNSIAKNTGISVKSIDKVYDHVFINEYDLHGGRRRFDADYYMAESFRRLREGKDIQEHDIIMLKHERLEYELMKKLHLKYDEAHRITERKYNYQKALNKFLKENNL